MLSPTLSCADRRHRAVAAVADDDLRPATRFGRSGGRSVGRAACRWPAKNKARTRLGLARSTTLRALNTYHEAREHLETARARPTSNERPLAESLESRETRAGTSEVRRAPCDGFQNTNGAVAARCSRLSSAPSRHLPPTFGFLSFAIDTRQFGGDLATIDECSGRAA